VLAALLMGGCADDEFKKSDTTNGMTADGVLKKKKSEQPEQEEDERAELETNAKERLEALAGLTEDKLNDLKNTPTSSADYEEEGADASTVLINKIQEDATYLLEIRELYEVAQEEMAQKEMAQNSIPAAPAPAADVTVTVDGTLYSVHFKDNVTDENLNESDVTPYIKETVDVEGNELDPASEDVAGLINHTSQDTGAASGRVCYDTGGFTIDCDVAGAPA
jgi:hypothetical protein